MARRKQAQPRPCYLHVDQSVADEDSSGSVLSCCDDDDDEATLPDLDRPEDEADDSDGPCPAANGAADIDRMPPTDGDVIAAAAPSAPGDSNAASAANSSLSVPFSCGYCQRSFPRLSLLKKHEQAHSDEMPFRCDYCLRMFKHKRSRDRHVKLHTGDKKYRCQHCEAAFSRSDHLKIHIKTHDTRKPFQCSVCQRGYSTAAALTSHMLNHRRESGSRCGSLCSSTSSNMSSPTSSSSSSSSSSSVRPAPSSSASTPCPASLPSPVSPPPTPTTDAAPPTIIGSGQQQQQQQPPPSAVTPPMELPSSPASPIMSPQQYQSRSSKAPTDSSRPVQPSVTEPATTTTSVQVKSDARKEDANKVETDSKLTPPIALQCPYCTQDSFASLSALSLHVQALHGPLARDLRNDAAAAEPARQQAGLLYACQLCSLRFGNLPALQQHTLSAHSLADVLRLYCPPPATRTPAVAETSGADNQLPTDLSCPKRRGADDETESRYCCPHCSAEFKQCETEALQSHVAGHLVSTWNEYGCSSCVKSFSSPDELQKHLIDMHAHHLYRCSLCKETFDSKVSIQVHLAVQHSSESKMYRCTACSPADDSAVFRLEADFNAHVASVHTSRIQPVKKEALKCPLCPLSFPVEFLLERHIHLNHNGQTSREVSPTIATAAAEKVAKSDKTEAPPTATVLNLSLHCAYCGESCKSRADLEAHMRTAHNPTVGQPPSVSANGAGGRIKCNICDEVFSSASVLAEHKLSHCKVSGAAVCATCRVPLPTEEAYYAHLQTPPHGPSASPPLACLVCRQTLSLPVEIGLHARFHTQSASEPALFPCCFCQRHLESASLIANGMAPNGQQTYVCKDCLHAHSQFAMAQHQTQSVLFPQVVPPPQLALAGAPRSYQCIKCQEIFGTEAEIQAHVLSSHLLSEGCLHPCRLCARQFDTPLKLQAHLIEHTFAGCPAFACYLCGCLFTAAASLQRHMFEQHGGAVGVRPYDCSRCRQQFFFRAELENHLLGHVEADAQLRPLMHPFVASRTAHAQVERRSNDTTEESEATRDEEDMDEDDNISVTSSSHASEITLSDAQKAANAIPDELGEERNTSKDSDMSDNSDSRSTASPPIQRKDKPETSGPFRCDRCDQSFPCLSNLQGHVRIHTQSRRFTCPEASCGKEFALRRNLHIHMRSHTGDRPYSCPMCPKRFARKENRKAHLKLHSGVKPFRCAVCSKTFARKSHLVEHGRTHASSVESSAQTVSKNSPTTQANGTDAQEKSLVV